MTCYKTSCIYLLIKSQLSVVLLCSPSPHKLNFGAWVSHCDFHLAILLGTLLIHTLHVRLCLASLLISILPTSQALRVKLQPALHQCWWAGSTPTLQHGNLFYPFDLKYGLEVTVMNWLKGPDVLLVVELPVTVTKVRILYMALLRFSWFRDCCYVHTSFCFNSVMVWFKGSV